MEEYLGISFKKSVAWIQVAIIVILTIASISLILSRNASPDSPLLFGLKRVQEKAFLNLKSGPEDKVDYMSSLLEERLKELDTLIKNGSFSYLWSASLRYSTFAGQITDLVVSNRMTDRVETIKKQFQDHKKVLSDLYVAYPKNTDNVEYKYLEDGINYLNIYLQKLDEIK